MRTRFRIAAPPLRTVLDTPKRRGSRDPRQIGANMANKKPEPEVQTAQVMFSVDGTKQVVAARSERDSADRHAVNGDLLAWGDYNESMPARRHRYLLRVFRVGDLRGILRELRRGLRRPRGSREPRHSYKD